METPYKDRKAIGEIMNAARTAEMKEKGEEDDRMQTFREIISAS